MAKGYIQSRDGVFWDDKERVIAALSLGKNAIKLSGDSEGAFSGSSAVAYRCEHCRLVVIEY